MPTVTAIGNQKGGVGKTSTLLGLAAALAAAGRRVLVVDLDAQANASTALGAEGEFDIYDVLSGGDPGTLGQATVSTGWDGVDVVPGTRQAARIEVESMIAPELRLKSAADGAAELDRYDDVLLDLPPNLGRLTLNGLIYADRVLVVTEAASFSVGGVQEFLDTVAAVRRSPHLNPGLLFAGIIVNKTHTPLTNEHAYQLDQLTEAFGDRVRRPVLPRRSAVEDAASARQPITALTGEGARTMSQLYGQHARWMIEESAS